MRVPVAENREPARTQKIWQKVCEMTENKQREGGRGPAKQLVLLLAQVKVTSCRDMCIRQLLAITLVNFGS